jgi:N-hydroxyarylamine O-acetyltransferase
MSAGVLNMGDGAPANAALMQRYLGRLGANVGANVYAAPTLSTSPTSPTSPTLPTLRDLMTRHLQTVPFENLDIVNGITPPLSTAGVLDKIVTRRRGGFCYELNEAFGALLKHLGFNVRRIDARVWLDQQQKFGAPFDHLALVVTLAEGEFLVDVGFGDNNRTPMRLPQDTLSDISGTYSLTQTAAHTWLLARSGRPLYEMLLNDQPLSAFEPMYRYHQTSPESIFAKGLICTKATPSGRITLSRDRLIVVDGAERTEIHISNRARVLSEHFGIVVKSQ